MGITSNCIAVTNKELGGLASKPVIRTDENCTSGEGDCFTFKEDDVNDIQCIGFGNETKFICESRKNLESIRLSFSVDAAKYGVIMCREDDSAYYPVSLYMQEDGICAFNETIQLELLDPAYPKLQNILGCIQLKIIHSNCNFSILKYFFIVKNRLAILRLFQRSSQMYRPSLCIRRMYIIGTFVRRKY